MNHIEQLWNKLAASYEAFASDTDSWRNTTEWPCIQKMLPDIRGRSVIDLGCGSGHYTFLLEEAGARKLTGVDISDEMLRIARERARERGSAAQFVKGDLHDFVPDEQYDIVFSSTMSHYIVDLFPLFANIYDMLVYKGICIISVINPIYSAHYPLSASDDSEASFVQPWFRGDKELEELFECSYHHTFSDYINAIIHNGLTILEMHEPLPPDTQSSSSDIPNYLIIKLQKS